MLELKVIPWRFKDTELKYQSVKFWVDTKSKVIHLSYLLFLLVLQIA